MGHSVRQGLPDIASGRFATCDKLGFEGRVRDICFQGMDIGLGL